MLRPVLALSVLVSSFALAGCDDDTGDEGGGGEGAGTPGAVPRVGGCDVFTTDDEWNREVSGDAVDSEMTAIFHSMAGGVSLHPDYGSGGIYGIPINVVPPNHPDVAIEFVDYPEESDPGPYPFPGPDDVRIEGGDAYSCEGDCHVLVVRQATCELFEGFACLHDGGWQCASGARWDLTANSYGQRPEGWTSADAAGLAILPGLLREEEVRFGEVRHALRFTMECTSAGYVKPATHDAATCTPGTAPPLGTRIRLRSDFDISGFSAGAQVVLTGMKRYGMILADNGSNFFFQGEANPAWNEDDIDSLKDVPSDAFEAIVPPP